MSDIPKLEPITDEIIEYSELTEFQEQLLDAAIAYGEVRCPNCPHSTCPDQIELMAWAKFKKLLVKATEISQ